VSMDASGKIIWAKQSEIQQVNVKQASSLADGEKLILPSKDLGTSEFFPQILKHSNNGRFVAVCGDGEFIIYTSVAWRNKSFGKGLEFAWGEDTGEYAFVIDIYTIEHDFLSYSYASSS
jgi:coatomer subunit beta'